MPRSVKLGWWLCGALPSRPWPSLNMILILSIAMIAFMGLDALSSGLSRAMLSTGAPDRVLFFSQGSLWEGMSRIAHDAARDILVAPEVARNDRGETVGSGETLDFVELTDDASGLLTSVPLRGTGRLSESRPEFNIVEGRPFASGQRELVIGVRLAERTRGTDVGDEIRIDGVPWTVVGKFASGDFNESSVVSDVETLRQHRSQAGFSSVLVKLTDESQASALIDRFGEDASSPLTGFVESEYYEMLNGMLPHFRLLQAFVAICLLVMVPVCVLHVMAVAVEGRKLEFAVLRALGFSRPEIFLALLVQIMVLTLASIAVAMATTWAIVHGSVVSIALDWQMVKFEMLINVETALLGALFGALAAALGSLAPAWRASRQTLATRATQR